MDLNNVLNTLTGREAFDLQEKVGFNLEDFEDAPKLKVMYGVAYIMKRRESAGVKWDAVLDLTITEVNEYLGLADETEEDDPKEK